MNRKEIAQITVMNALSHSGEIAKDLFPACHAINPYIHKKVEDTERIVRSCLLEVWSNTKGGPITSCSTGSIHAQVRFYEKSGNCEAEVLVSSCRRYSQEG